MKWLSVLFFLFFANCLSAQSDTLNQNTDTSKIIPAKFPGGMVAWNKFIEHNVNSTLIVTCGCVEVPFGEAVAKVTANVRFLIDASGNVTNVIVVNEKEIDKVFVREAIRVVTKSPKWIPAEKNNKKVSYESTSSVRWLMSK